MEGRDGDAILLDIDTVLQRVRLGNLADGVRHGWRGEMSGMKRKRKGGKAVRERGAGGGC